MTLRILSIDKEIYNKAVDAPWEIQKMEKVKINLFLPPTDIPKFVSSEFDNKTDIFRIKFQYSLLEKGKYLFSDSHASLLVGEQSGKPLIIEIKNIKENKINEIHLLASYIRNELERAMSAGLSRLQDLRQRTNIERAQQVLNQHASELAEAVA